MAESLLWNFNTLRQGAWGCFAGHTVKTLSYVLVSAALSAAPAFAQGYTDCRSLNELCQDGVKYPTSAQACKGYIGGALDQLLTDHRRDFCLDKGTPVSQVQEAVTKWLAEHTNQGHLSGSSCVLLAVSQSFPCNKK
jgi:hypothetical protein